MGHLCSAAAADLGRLGRPRGSQRLPSCGIWPELSKKVSWASLAQKLSILEVKIGGKLNFQLIFFFCLCLCLHNWTKIFPK